MDDEDIGFDYFDIDLGRLEEELVGQARAFRVQARKLAKARRAWEQAKVEVKLRKAEMEQVDAELELDIRRDHTAYGLDKVTESAVGKVVLIQERHVKSFHRVIEAEREVIEHKHLADVLEADVNALDHRKTAMSKLVDLFQSAYWAKPRPKGEGAKDLTERKIDAALGKRRRD